MRYDSVQVARAAAAILVVYFHSITMVSHAGLLASAGSSWPQAGVDLFFAISGFVMVATTRKSWGEPRAVRPFVVRRFIRVVPMYWLFTLVKLLGVWRFRALAMHRGLSIYYIAASFLFVPARVPGEATVAPLLQVGWTLSFEMFFYLLFAVAIGVTRNPVPVLCATLAFLSIVGSFWTAGWPAAATTVNPILLEFVFGMLIAELIHAGRALAPSHSYVALALALVSLVLSDWILGPKGGDLFSPLRVVAYGVPGAIALLAVISLEIRGHLRLVLTMPVLLLLGDASYAIYLSHGLVLLLPRVLITRLHMTGPLAAGVLIVVGVVLSACAGIVIHLFVERPLGRWLHRCAMPRPSLRRMAAGPADA